MDKATTNRLLLGIPSLIPVWKKLFSTEYLGADLIAGTTVAFIAIPLSLAIALASGVDPAVGLITAIIAGIVCALFGGTPLAVSGPAAAMSVLIASNAESFGLAGVTLICLIAGLMQLVSGMAGLGKLGRYVPLPVISGFTAGIGFIILVGQLPRAFGLPPPPESHVFEVFDHIKEYIHDINGTTFFLVVTTIVIIRGLPRLLPKIPPILPAVIFSTLIVYFFELKDVALIGKIPQSLPPPHLPKMIDISMGDLILNSFTVFLLASLETLLSSSAVDKLSGGKKHNSDQELIGQGLGNVAVSLFGGIPVTGVIARSATNIKAGAKTRRSSIIHSIIILLAVYAIAPLISLIPIAALAGVLFSVAFGMLDYKEFHNLWVNSRSEALIYVVTFFTIVFTDLIAGVQAGIIAASLIILFRAARTNLHVTPTSRDDVIRLSLTGSLTFLSTGKIIDLLDQLKPAHAGQTVVLDLTTITDMDTSGAAAIIDLFNHCNEHNINFYIKGLPRRFEPLFLAAGGETLIKDHYLISEHELRKVNGEAAPPSSLGRLIHGVHRYYFEHKSNDKRLFEFIAEQQDPHTLFITCSDSRIIPSLITSSDPGELFIIRNVGNFIPPFQADMKCSEAAALEFALNSLDITDIVICGHASCGAIKACMDDTEGLPTRLKAWINLIKAQLKFDSQTTQNEIARMNVLNQVENIKKYPVVQEKISRGELKIHAWFFDFDLQIIYEWNSAQNDFTPIVLENTA